MAEESLLGSAAAVAMMLSVSLTAAAGEALAQSDAVPGEGARLAASEGAASGVVPGDFMDEGKRLFQANCRLCHGSKGTAGVPLANNGKLAGAEYLAHTILTGPGYMTAFGAHLDDGQIAAIATYVRNSWGNEFGPVTAEEVASQR